MFPLAARVDGWFETRLTPLGRLLAGAFVAAAIFGTDPHYTLSGRLAAVLLGLLAAGALYTLRWHPPLHLRRELPEFFVVDQTGRYTLVITNESQRPELELTVRDRLSARFPSPEEVVRMSPPDDPAAINWFDRKVGFLRWLRAYRYLRGGEIEPHTVSVPAATSVAVDMSLTALRRGRLSLERVHCYRPDPLGLFAARAAFPLRDEILVLPRTYSLPRFKLVSHRTHQPGGLSQALSIGESREFIALRDYRPGDPIRHIHWRSFARHQRPVVKEFQDEYFDRHALILDGHVRPGRQRLFEVAVSITASILVDGSRLDSVLDMVFVGDRFWRVATGPGAHSGDGVLPRLAAVEPDATDRCDLLEAEVRGHLDQLASVVFVTCEWDPRRAALIDEVRTHRVNVLVVRVVAEPTATSGCFDEAGCYRVDVDRLESDLAALRIPEAGS